MKFLQKSPDGGKDSGVTGFFVVEVKPLFSIVILRFNKGTREAYHSHAFHALTFWLKGRVREEHLNGETKWFSGGMLKYTPRTVFHRINALETSYAISFRGPWKNTWKESRSGEFVTLTHGRKICQ